MIKGIHEALSEIAGGHDAGGVDALIEALRQFESRQPGAGIEALCHYLEAYPLFRASLRALLCRWLADESAAALYADTGILANTGFFTELNRRLVGRLLPPPCDDSLRGQFGILFGSGADAQWLRHVPGPSWECLLEKLFADEPAHGCAPAWQGVLDAIDLLSVRIAAMGVEPELQRHYRVPREHNNPFLAQNAEVQLWLNDARLVAPRQSMPDARQVLVLLDQCRDVIARVRRSARQIGASLALTFLLRRLEQSLQRLQDLLGIAASHHESPAAAAVRRMALVVQLAAAEGRAHDIADHWRASTGMLALQVTENASRTGEHYVTRTRKEYREMFRSALGAGAIIGVMALVKVWLASLHLPPLVEAVAFSANYAAGFVLIYILHFTIATKQPAMTAQTIAGHLSAAQGGRLDEGAIGLLASRVSRTQVIAILGNVLLAVPVAGFLLWTLLATGTTMPAGKSAVLLDELHPLASPALFHAALAGLWLFLAGLVSGYFDNLAAYERLAERILRIRWMARLFSVETHRRLAAWMEENLGGISGNVFFGFALGLTGFFGLILGLPLDIRHVTFSAANLSLVVVDPAIPVSLTTLLVAASGVFLIAVVNVATSFSLALWIAMRARGLGAGEGSTLLRALGRRIRSEPLAFLYPPRREEQPEEPARPPG